MATTPFLIVLYVITLLIYLGYIGAGSYFIWELYQRRESLVLNKRHTYPIVMVSLVTGVLWITFYLIPATTILLDLPSDGAWNAFVAVATILQYIWIYALLFRVYQSWWDIHITSALQQYEWHAYIDDRTADDNWFIANQTTLGDHKIMLRVLSVAAVGSIIFASFINFTPMGTWPRIVQLFLYLCWVFLEFTPWLATILLVIRIPRFEDLYHVKDELKRIFICAGVELLVYIIVLVIVQLLKGFSDNHTTTSTASITGTTQTPISTAAAVHSSGIPAAAAYTLVTVVLHCFALSVFVNMYLMSRWVQQKLGPEIISFSNNFVHKRMYQAKQQEKLQQELKATENKPDAKNAVSPKGAGRTNSLYRYNLKDVLGTEYGFDLFMRHLVKEFCHENLLAFYEFELFQMLILKDLERSVDVDTADLALMDFPKTLPKPKLITYPIEVHVVYLDNPEDGTRRRTYSHYNPENPYQGGLIDDGMFAADEENEMKTEAERDLVEYDKKVHEYKKRSHDLYCKYIQVGCNHEINIPGGSRARYQVLFDNFTLWKDNSDYNSKEALLHVFDACKQEVIKLLGFVFRRFQRSPLYDKWLQIKLAEDKKGM